MVKLDQGGGATPFLLRDLDSRDEISIPTAPTNHLPDWWTLRNFTRGQKGADKANEPVLVR